MRRVYSFDYDATYDPPAPCIPITVDGLDPTKGPVTVTAFVDSGADGTMLPIDILQAVGAVYEASVWLRGTTGSDSGWTAIPSLFTSKPKLFMPSRLWLCLPAVNL